MTRDPHTTTTTTGFALPPSCPCGSPPEGDWVVTESCTFEGAATATANVIADNGATLTIVNGAMLDIALTQYRLSCTAVAG